MEQVSLEAKPRDGKGKVLAKQLRQQGLIPAIIYGAGIKSESLVINQKEFKKVLHTAAGGNVLISLKVLGGDGSKDHTVIIKEIQHEPLHGDILHIDFNEISLTQLITVSVPITGKGESPGVKEGGVMDFVLRELEVKCLPTDIPQHIDVDVSALNIGDSIFVRDVVLPAGVKVLNQPELTVVTVEPPVVEKVEVAPAEAQPAEPEVIKQKKEEAEGEEAEEKGKEKEKGKEAGK